MYRQALKTTSPSSRPSGSQTLPDFKYEALPDSSNYIRLVEVCQEDNGQGQPDKTYKVCCRITHVPVLEEPVYQALSYTWGEDAPSHDIELNGCRFQVTENLYWFLYHHSRAMGSGTKTRLWIDAICIDQTEHTEKGHQVQMMGEIYQKAQFVFVWLGHHQSADVDKALSFLAFAEQYFGDASVEKEYQERFGDDGTHLIVALQTLFENDYWSRTWIVQEVILAKMLVVCCGSRQITWNSLDFWTRNTNAIFSAMGKPPREPHLPIRRLRVEDLLDMKNKREKEKDFPGLDLDYLINNNEETYCKDPRDRVFALLSLAPTPKYVEMIRVDYTKTTEEIFFDVVKFLHEERQQGSCTRALIRALRLPWSRFLDYMHPGEREMALFDSKQTFLLVATMGGVVTKVVEPTRVINLSSLRDDELLHFSCFRTEIYLGELEVDINFRGLANSSIRLGDIFYYFGQIRSGFIARRCQSTADTGETFEFISEATINYTSEPLDGMPLFDADFNLVNRVWRFDKFRVRKFTISDHFPYEPEVWFDVGRREIVEVLFGDLPTE